MTKHLRLWWLWQQYRWGWLDFRTYFIRCQVLRGEWEQIGPGHYQLKTKTKEHTPD